MLELDFLARAVQGAERVEVQGVDGVQMWVSVVVVQQAVGERCVGAEVLRHVWMQVEQVVVMMVVVVISGGDDAGQRDGYIAEARFGAMVHADDVRRRAV